MTKRRNGMRGESGREKSSPRKIEELSRQSERARVGLSLLRTVFVAPTERGNILGWDEMGILDVKSSRWG